MDVGPHLLGPLTYGLFHCFPLLGPLAVFLWASSYTRTLTATDTALNQGWGQSTCLAPRGMANADARMAEEVTAKSWFGANVPLQNRSRLKLRCFTWPQLRHLCWGGKWGFRADSIVLASYSIPLGRLHLHDPKQRCSGQVECLFSNGACIFCGHRVRVRKWAIKFSPPWWVNFTAQNCLEWQSLIFNRKAKQTVGQ